MEEDRAEAGAAAIEEALAEEPPGGARDGGGATSEAEGKNPSSSSDSESDDEAAEGLQIETLEAALAENPLNYEAHVQYIQCLRKSGHVEKLRQARNAMNERFPLSPKMWQEWTKDEISLSEGLEAFTEIEKLYERGVHEYLSVPLWYDYINFVQEHDQSVSQCSPSGISKMRNLFERALTAAGLHIVEGNKIWEAYREFEQAILLTIDDNNNEEKAKQVQRIRALFHRQLSVPLVDLRSTLMDCKFWEGEQGNVNDMNSDFDGIPSNVITSYQKAIEMYNARKQYEDILSNPDTSDTDRLQQFKNYLKFEESSGDPARVQILYERAVAEFPISSDLWLGYTSYLDRTLKVPDLFKSVYSRATRNCTWVGELWVRYLLSLERIHASEEELSAVFEQSLQCGFPSFKEYLDLFLTRVDGLRRRMSIAGAKEDELDYALIRDTFQRAVEYLSPQLVSWDDLLHLHAYWARLEANLGKDMLAARGVWENLLKKSGSLLEVWLSYIEMETAMGHINEARSIYKRCYSKRFPGTGSEDICHSWLRFEREYGTLDDLDLAVKKVTPRLQELMTFKTQQEPKKELMLSSKRESSVSTNAQQKRKLSKMSSDKQPPAKRKKENAPKPVEASDVDQIKPTGNANDTGAVDKGEVATLPKTVETTATNEEAVGNLKITDSKPKFYNDQCTAFVSNLSLEASEKHLQEFFSDCGGVTGIRLLRDKFTGRSRGLAYVDFSDDEHLAMAIAKNKQKLLGRKLGIARSDPKQSHKRSSTGSSSSKGHGQGARFRNDHNRSVEVSEGTFEGRRGNNVKLMGKNTFAAPRAVAKSQGRSNKEAKIDGETEKPKSNDEFRDMFLKK